MRLEEPDKRCLGDNGWVEYVKNKQDLAICHYFWPAKGECEGVLLAVHGHGAHAQYEFLTSQSLGEPCVYSGSWVERYNKKGVSVCALDIQSHGRSEGARGLKCYAEKFQDFVDDVIDFARWLKESKNVAGFSNHDVYILGMSLGGCIATNAIHQQGELFKGAVLLAPMLSLEKLTKKGCNPYLRPCASFLSAVLPTLAVVKGVKDTKFPEVQETYDKDPGCWHRKTRVRLAAEYMRTTKKTCKSFKDMRFPFIALHCSQDDTIDPDGSKQLYEFSQSKDKTLKLIDGMCHSLIREPGNEDVQITTLEWLLKRL